MNTRSSSYGRQEIDDADIEAVVSVLRSDFLTGGSVLPKFESALAEKLSAPYVVACNSGTSALHLALLALGIGPGDTIFVPSISFSATANAGRYVGANVRFTDVDPETALMRQEDLVAAISKWRSEGHEENVAAILPVHFAGQTVDLPALAEIARKEGSKVVVDACHALGSRYGVTNSAALPVGCAQHADAEVFSFHPVKNITTGEGGAICFRKEEAAQVARDFRSHGIVKDQSRYCLEVGRNWPWYHEMQSLGFNYRLSDIGAALGLSQLGKIDRFADKRRELMARYCDKLREFSPVVSPLRQHGCDVPAWHLNVVLIDFQKLRKTREQVMRWLAYQKVGTQVHYIPIPDMPYYSALREEISDGTKSGGLPGARKYYSQTLTLPLHTSMDLTDVAFVISKLSELVKK